MKMMKKRKARLATMLTTSGMLLAIASPAMAGTEHQPQMVAQAEEDAIDMCAQDVATGLVDPAEFRECVNESILARLVSQAEGLDWVPEGDNWFRQPESGLRWHPEGGWWHPQFGVLSFDPS